MLWRIAIQDEPAFDTHTIVLEQVQADHVDAVVRRTPFKNGSRKQASLVRRVS